MRYSRIAGTGSYVPDRVVTNDELAKLMDTSDEWIRERSGIRERRFAAEDQSTADLALFAARNAMDAAGWEPGDLDFIVFATISPDYYFPGNGVLLQAALDTPQIGALDVRNQCTGFVYALAAADGFVRMGLYNKVLVVGAEIQSAGLDLTTKGRDTAVLFGDGAGAVCLEAVEDETGGRILDHHLHSDGNHADDLAILAPSSRCRPFVTSKMIEEGKTSPQMNGREVYRHAVLRFPQVIKAILEANGYSADDVDMVVPHQANLRIIEAVRKRLGLPEEKVYTNVQRFGNTTAASIPLALDEAVRAERIRRGDLVCLAAFGSGFTWGASLVRF